MRTRMDFFSLSFLQYLARLMKTDNHIHMGTYCWVVSMDVLERARYFGAALVRKICAIKVAKREAQRNVAADLARLVEGDVLPVILVLKRKSLESVHSHSRIYSQQIRIQSRECNAMIHKAAWYVRTWSDEDPNNTSVERLRVFPHGKIDQNKTQSIH